MALAMVLGAGASLAAPAARPLFAWLRAALVDHLALPTGSAFDAQRFSYLAPEALLSRLAQRGIDIDAELLHLLAGGAPNAVHFVAAEALAAGNTIWTTNFDELVEQAAAARAIPVHRLLLDGDPACRCGRGHVIKVHGTLSERPLVARSEDVLSPLPDRWLERLRDDLHGADVAVVGYAGADIDLRAGLRDALRGAASTVWFGTPADQVALQARFHELIDAGAVRLVLSSRPDLDFLNWAAAHGLTGRIPTDVQRATRGPIPDVQLPAPLYRPDLLLRAQVLDDFGEPALARSLYRRAALRGPDRRRALKALLSTGLIHGAPWRPAMIAALHAVCATPLPFTWPHRQLILYLTWSGHPAESWAAARRALDRLGDRPGLVMQAANAAKECEPAAAVRLAELAQRDALGPGKQRDATTAAWATFCLSFALRWVGDTHASEQQATRLADGLDALAGPVWIAWGHFELGALAALRNDVTEAATHLRSAREVFVAAGARNFVFDALCAEIVVSRQAGDEDTRAACFEAAERMITNGERTSRFAREVLLVERSERCRELGQLTEAERGYRTLATSPTAAQQMLGLLGLGEVQRARRQQPDAAREALARSRALHFGFGEVHAAVTLGLAGVLSASEAEHIIAASRFNPPQRRDADGLLRFCVGADPAIHSICFP